MLPLKPPLPPMLAKLSTTLPEGDGWVHEPKWDGFRAIVFKDGDKLTIQSRDLKPLGRYFPELETQLRAGLPERIVVDGEIVIARDGALDFEALLLRIHPAESRVQLLAQQTPSSFVAFDILALGDDDLTARPFQERRVLLEKSVKAPLHVTPATTDRALADDWFKRFEGAGLDGIVSKKVSDAYTPGKRVMVKTKHIRSADVVVAGYRTWKRKKDAIGSLVLGLYDDKGRLHHVGVCAAFTAGRRAELFQELQPLRDKATENHPWKEWADVGDHIAAGSRWSRGKDMSWFPLRLERVCEVKYDHMEGERFRHATHFLRWRPDKQPADCTYAQLDVTPPHELAAIFAASTTAQQS